MDLSVIKLIRATALENLGDLVPKDYYSRTSLELRKDEPTVPVDVQLASKEHEDKPKVDPCFAGAMQEAELDLALGLECKSGWLTVSDRLLATQLLAANILISVGKYRMTELAKKTDFGSDYEHLATASQEVALQRLLEVVPPAYLKSLGYETIPLQTKSEMKKPNLAGASPSSESKEQREDRRLQACIDYGLPMFEPASKFRLPNGVGKVAAAEGVTRQTFSADIKSALNRWNEAKREGSLVHLT